MQYNREYTLDIKEDGANPTTFTRAVSISLLEGEQFSDDDSPVHLMVTIHLL